MKKYILIIFSLFSFFQIYSQSLNSDIYLKRLTSFSNVWGLLKYYHPALKKNKISFEDWNRIFIEKSKLINVDQTNADFNNIISDFIEIPGKIDLKENKIDTALLANEIFNWIKSDSILNNNNKESLYKIIVFGKKIKHKQLAKEINGQYKTTVIDNYNDFSYNLFSLMGVSCYLQELKYYYPYEKLQNLSNYDLHLKYLPKAIICNDKADYISVLNQIASEINDSHAATTQYQKRLLSLTLREANDTVFVLRNHTNIKEICKGDILIAVNNKPLKLIIDSLNKFISASTVATKKKRVIGSLLYHNEDIKLSLLDSEGVEYNITANAKENNLKYQSKGDIKTIMKNKRDSSFYIINDVGYINNFFLPKNKIHKAFRTLKNTKGIIIDLRNYVPYGIDRLTKYISKKSGNYINLYFNSKTNPGIFVSNFKSEFAGKLHYTRNSSHLYKKYYKSKPILVLISENSISYMDMYALAIKYCRPDAIFVGSTTSGTFGSSNRINIPGGYYINISAVKCLSFDGNDIQGIGVSPDIYVQPSVKDILSGNDLILQKAINRILQN